MRSDEALLLDMLIAARKILRFTQDMSFVEFGENDMAQSAVIREFQVIGEAARLITDETQAAHDEIDWYAISGMRNRLVHEYFAIRLDVVWQTIQEDIASLITQLETLIPPDEG
jgi:uncharacterized protein with HEPN domain